MKTFSIVKCMNNLQYVTLFEGWWLHLNFGFFSALLSCKKKWLNAKSDSHNSKVN